MPSPLDADARLLLIGLVAALAAEVAHNLFDSDLYVPANALTLGALCGLTLALARPRGAQPTAPSAARRGEEVKWLAATAGALLGLYALLIGVGRLEAFGAETALRAGDPAAAIQGYQSAVGMDRWNPEYRLTLATLYQRTRQPAEAERAFRGAVRTAPVGKTVYRYGRFLEEQGRTADAIRQYERARRLDPHNLRDLVALGGALSAVGRPAEAQQVYRDMVALYRSPVGQVRAIPEMVEWEYAVAFLGLAEADLARADRAAAEPMLREGAGLLGEWWRTRDTEMGMSTPNAAGMPGLLDRYDWALGQWADTLRALGRPAEADKVVEKRTRFQAERAQREEKERQSGGNANPG